MTTHRHSNPSIPQSLEGPKVPTRSMTTKLPFSNLSEDPLSRASKAPSYNEPGDPPGREHGRVPNRSADPTREA